MGFAYGNQSPGLKWSEWKGLMLRVQCKHGVVSQGWENLVEGGKAAARGRLARGDCDGGSAGKYFLDSVERAVLM